MVSEVYIEKRCSACLQTLPAAKFYKCPKGGLRHICVECWKSQGAERHLNRKYGITGVELARRIAAQDNLCSICKRSFLVCKPVVDHSHKTGEVRDILCDTCNRGLGYFYENPESLSAAAEYVRRYSTSS